MLQRLVDLFSVASPNVDLPITILSPTLRIRVVRDVRISRDRIFLEKLLGKRFKMKIREVALGLIILSDC